MRILYPILLGLFLPLLLTAQWQSLPNPNSSAVRQIMEFNGQLLVSDDFGLARSFDGGVHWQRITSDGAFGQIMPSGQDIYGIKNHPQTGLKSLLKSADTGQSWDTISTFIMNEPSSMVEANGCIYIMTNQAFGPVATVEVFDLGTKQLTQLGYFAGNDRRAFDLKVCGDAAFFASDWGLIRYQNCGAQIDTFSPFERHTLVAVKGDTVFSANTNLDLIYSTDFGDSWQTLSHQSFWLSPRKLFFLNNEAWLSSMDDVLSCDTRLWRLDGSLTQGTETFRLKSRCINDILALDNENFVVATSAGIMSAHWSDDSWFVNNSGLGQGLFQIEAEEDVLLNINGSTYSADKGETWTYPVFDGESSFGLNGMVKKDSIYFAAVGYGGLMQSLDLKNWTSLAGDIPWVEIVGDYLMTATGSGQIRLSTEGINWATTSAYFPVSQPSKIVTVEGLIFVLVYDGTSTHLEMSSDLGMSWQNPLNSIPGAEVWNIFAQGPNVYIVASVNQNTGFYVSHDYGHNWKPMPAPNTDLFNAPYVSDGNLFFTSDAQTLWVTANDGETWAEIDRDTIQGQIIHLTAGLGDLYVCSTEGSWRRSISGIKILQYAGTVFNDLNFNGLRDTLEPGIPNTILKVSNRNWYVATDSLGQYAIVAELINDTISVTKPVEYCSIVPPFVLSNPSQLNQDFGVQLQAGIIDVGVSAANNQVFRPGFETEVLVSIQNKGTTPLDSVWVTLAGFGNAASLQLLESDPPPSTISGDTLTWEGLTLDLFEQKQISLRFKTSVDVLLGGMIGLPFAVYKTGDIQLADNHFILLEPIVSSFDPNDKRVQPDSVAPIGLSTTDLYYTIRFQNTGNYPADFVTILDSLPEELDLSSLKILGASHPYTWRIRDGRVLEFLFKPIDLPDSLTNELRSHGFAQFSIRANGNLPLGTMILNRAAIYFDYNPPVLTDFSIMNVAQTMVNTQMLYPESTLRIQPNPAVEYVLLEKDAETEGWLHVYASDGRSILSQQTQGKVLKLEIRNWPNGIYIIQWISEGKSLAGKLIKR